MIESTEKSERKTKFENELLQFSGAQIIYSSNIHVNCMCAPFEVAVQNERYLKCWMSMHLTRQIIEPSRFKLLSSRGSNSSANDTAFVNQCSLRCVYVNLWRTRSRYKRQNASHVSPLLPLFFPLFLFRFLTRPLLFSFCHKTFMSI